jgi:transcriptional regulator with XRE-family HTH domain
MDELIERLKKDLRDEEARYVYADTVTNAFVATQIKSLREERGFSQEQLATLIGTQQSGVSRLEKADYSAWKVETLRKLAKALGVRLRIRFEEFGTLRDEITGFDDRNLLPRRFEDDPAFKTTRQSRQRTRKIRGYNRGSNLFVLKRKPRRHRRKPPHSTYRTKSDATGGLNAEREMAIAKGAVNA